MFLHLVKDRYSYDLFEKRWQIIPDIKIGEECGIFCAVEFLFLKCELTEDPAGCYRLTERLSPSKNPAGILIHQGLL